MTSELAPPAQQNGSPAAVPALAAGTGSPELSVIVPTFNEAANVRPLVERLHAALAGLHWEVIFVDDDSPDRTAAAVHALAAADPRVRCLRRVGRRGLASACVEGMLASTAPLLAVMDADLQHDERLLPAMVETLRGDRADLVIGSRYLHGRDVPGWDERRQGLSHVATRLARMALRVEVSDPMSGFFMLRKELLDRAVHRLSATGFKILLDLIVSAPTPPRIRELPYTFRQRQAGESKFDGRAAQDFLLLLLDKTLGRWMPARFVLFSMIGGLGVAVHLAVLLLLFKGLGTGFIAGQTVATLVAMTSNFALNNELTYRDRRLRGWRWLKGWLIFCITCSIGALANVGIAAQLFVRQTPWLLSALGGIAVGAVWNYAVSAFYTWDRPSRP
jgi:dolichol-phosphate mannosyltransferase